MAYTKVEIDQEFESVRSKIQRLSERIDKMQDQLDRINLTGQSFEDDEVF